MSHSVLNREINNFSYIYKYAKSSSFVDGGGCMGILWIWRFKFVSLRSKPQRPGLRRKPRVDVGKRWHMSEEDVREPLLHGTVKMALQFISRSLSFPDLSDAHWRSFCSWWAVSSVHCDEAPPSSLLRTCPASGIRLHYFLGVIIRQRYVIFSSSPFSRKGISL